MFLKLGNVPHAWRNPWLLALDFMDRPKDLFEKKFRLREPKINDQLLTLGLCMNPTEKTSILSKKFHLNWNSYPSIIRLNLCFAVSDKMIIRTWKSHFIAFAFDSLLILSWQIIPSSLCRSSKGWNYWRNSSILRGKFLHLLLALDAESSFSLESHFSDDKTCAAAEGSLSRL